MEDQEFEKKLENMELPDPGLLSREEEETAWKEIMLEIEAKKSNTTKWWLAAASVVLVLVMGWWLFPDQENIYATNEIEKLDIQLPDNSKVTLNRNSQLKVLEGFDDEDRSVSLKGEAFFNIERDEQRPFIIHLGSQQVRVLGTSFSVDHKDNSTIVVVRTGKVQVSSKSDSLVLTNSQKAIVDDSGKISIADWDINDLAWYSGSVNFENKTMKQVAETLSKLSDKQVTVSARIADCQLNLKMEYERIEEVFEVIAETLDIFWKEEPKRIYFDGKGC